MNTNAIIDGLLQKPLWQMTGEEYCQLTHYALSHQSVLAVSLATHHNPCKGVGIVLPIDIACWQRSVIG